MQTYTRVRRACRLTLVIAIGAAISVGQAAWARDDSATWSLKLDVGWLSPSGSEVTVVVDDVTSKAKFDTGAGAGLRAERRLTDLLGIEFGVFSAGSLDVESSIAPGMVRSRVSLGSITPITLGLNAHLTRGSAIDLYVGPQVGLVRYGTLDIRTGTGDVTERVSADDNFAWGVILGLDVPLGRHGWSVQGSVRYLDIDLDSSSGTAFVTGDMNPTIVSIGVGYTF